MALIRWDPIRGLDFTREMWNPSVDIVETENEIVIKAELPGMEAKDIGISLENNVLMLRGERRFENEAKNEQFHRVERSYGKFSRSFALPAFVDEANVRADYKDGILRVLLPKQQQARSKRIGITAA